MSLGRAVHQMPGRPGRNAGRRDETELEASGMETCQIQSCGSAGVDGSSIAETAGYQRTHWPRIRASLLDASYRRQSCPISQFSCQRRREVARGE